MPTFANWLKEQAGRDDAVGYTARYWETNSPGRISSVSGVEKTLLKIEQDYAGQDPPEGMELPAWRRGQAAIAAAISGYRLAVREYHGEEARANYERTQADLAQPPETEPGPDAEDARQAQQGREELAARSHEITEPPAVTAGTVVAAKPEAAPARYTGWPESRFDRLESKLDLLLDAVKRTEHAYETILDALYPEPIDWDALWRAADREQ